MKPASMRSAKASDSARSSGLRKCSMTTGSAFTLAKASLSPVRQRRSRRRSVLIRSTRGRTKCNGRRDGHHPAVIAANYLPLALMDKVVMPVTEKCQVGRLIVPAVQPMLDVVSRGPARRPLAAGPCAAPVACVERFARRTRDRPLGPPDVDDRGLRTEHDARDRGVTGQPLDGLGGDWYSGELQVGS